MNSLSKASFAGLLALVAAIGSAQAQSPTGAEGQSARIYHVGLLTNGPVIGATDERRKNLVSGLAAQGLVEGRNLIFEQRSADGEPRRVAGLLRELESSNIDVLVTFDYPPALPAKNAARAIHGVI